MGILSVFRKKNNGKLFPKLKPWSFKFRKIRNANEMIQRFNDHLFSTDRTEFGEIPAGYTYLGQFIAHDLTFTKNKFRRWKTQKKLNPDIFHRPRLDLESVYGLGPDLEPYFFETLNLGRTTLKLKKIDDIRCSDFVRIGDIIGAEEKSQNQIPLIPDARNDENILVSQLHVAFALFHNKLIEIKIKKRPILNNFLLEKNIEIYDHTPKPEKKYIASHFIPVSPHSFNSEEITLSSLQQIAEELQKFKLKNLNKVKKVFESDSNTLITKNSNTDNFTFLIEKILETEELNVLKNEAFKDISTIINDYIKLESAFKEKATLELDDIFKETRKKVLQHYHAIILYDYLPKFVSNTTISSIILNKNERRIFEYKKTPFLPKEFSIAFFRFGHSLIRRSYLFNNYERPRSIFSPKRINTPLETKVNWNLFFPNPKYNFDLRNINKAGKIDSSIVFEMFNDLGVPIFNGKNTFSKNIAFRNIRRGDIHKITSGQKIGNELVRKKIIKRHKLVDTLIKDHKKNGKFDRITKFKDRLIRKLLLTEGEAEELMSNSPLWFYTLMEAELCENGDRLGPVAGRIIAEVFIGIIEDNPDSILPLRNDRKLFNIEGFNLKYTMVELLEYVGFYPPTPPTSPPPPPDTSGQ